MLVNACILVYISICKSPDKQRPHNVLPDNFWWTSDHLVVHRHIERNKCHKHILVMLHLRNGYVFTADSVDFLSSSLLCVKRSWRHFFAFLLATSIQFMVASPICLHTAHREANWPPPPVSCMAIVGWDQQSPKPKPAQMQYQFIHYLFIYIYI